MLEFKDIQAFILSGYGHQTYSCFYFYQINDASQARQWLNSLVPKVTHAEQRDPDAEKPPTAINLAFSAGGLTALGIDSETLSSFPREFTGGDNFSGSANPMSSNESADLLQDWGDSAPDNWQFGGPQNAPAHVQLMFFATTKEELETLCNQHKGNDSHGVTEVYQQHSNRSGDREAFGFHDGISQPGIIGSYIPTKPGQRSVNPGEFILGYANAYDQKPPSPTVSNSKDPLNILPDNGENQRDLGKNGTYLAVRKLEQHVDAFWDFCAEKTKNTDGSNNEDKKTWLASKMIGRWPSGAPLALCPMKDDPAIGADPLQNNNFVYSDDPNGLGCPMGAHLRRGNPRDNLPPDSIETSIKVTDRHRIIRRGRPYNDADGNEQGLMFMAVNADIQRQFQFVMQTWINSPKFGLMDENKDPILSGPKLLAPAPNGSKESVMVIPQEPVRQRINGLKRFVDVRGGGYFFMPGIKALQFITSNQ